MLPFGIDLIREELSRRESDSTGCKELVQRLEADIRQRYEATPWSSDDSTEVAGNEGFPFDPATLESLTLLFQELSHPSTTITPLPDLSSLIVYFDDSPKQNVNVWLSDARHVQQPAAWDATTRLIAASKFKAPLEIGTSLFEIIIRHGKRGAPT
ncbi:hypothetical protein HPB52_000290 [Rhipicephalus sanguineus]|uniref:Uncharacterized protein n=1 Tax=Rhipicephalus sanguineus TaxID=34632 RepID=A0A9D4PT25_RHISA|nr:hypothetical protein HPB52_000290 [Rhipicephalus sanguineus]